MPSLQEEQAGPPHRCGRRRDLQGLGLLPDGLPPELLHGGREEGRFEPRAGPRRRLRPDLRHAQRPGRLLDADEALRLGLVNHVVADDAVAETVAGMAAEIAAGAPLVARWHKRLARKLRDGETLSDGDHAESFACFDTEDFKTGYRSFLAKQPPIFRGR